MATEHRWKSVDGNWNAATSWDSGQVPGAGGSGTDSAILDGSLSQVSVTSGLVPGGNALLRIQTGPFYTGDLGYPSNPLTLQIISAANDPTKAVFRGSGRVYFKSTSGDYTDVVVDSANLLDAVSLSGDIRHVFVKRGYARLESGLTALSDVHVLGALASIEVPSGQSYAGRLTVDAGVCLDAGGIGSTLVSVSGGTLIRTGKLFDTTTLILTGGILRYTPTASVATDNPNAILLGGTLDISGNSQPIIFGDRIIGPNVTILGDLLGTGNPSGLGVVIDLREDNP